MIGPDADHSERRRRILKAVRSSLLRTSEDAILSELTGLSSDREGFDSAFDLKHRVETGDV